MKSKKLYLHRKNIKPLLPLGIVVAGLGVGLVLLNQNLDIRQKAAPSSPKLALEAIHYNTKSGHERNVNGFYQPDTKHYIPEVLNQFTSDGTTYNHSITVQNPFNKSAVTTITYYDRQNEVYKATATIPPFGFKVFYSGLPKNFAGSATVVSSSPTLVEVAVAGSNGTHRGFSAASSASVGKKVYVPIAYSRVFGEYDSTLILQNAGTSSVPVGTVKVTARCTNGSPSFELSNSQAIKPNSHIYIPIKVPAHLIRTFTKPDGSTVRGFCDDTAESNSELFGHAEIVSPQPIAGSLIVYSKKGTQRQELLSPHLSTKFYVPSVILGQWLGHTQSSSLNISNPNDQPANVFVSVYRNKNGKTIFHEKRRPQGPSPMAEACSSSSDSIPPLGERSFFFKADISTEKCPWDHFGSNEEAFGFSIVTSDVPIDLSYNKTVPDDYAETGLADEIINSTVYLPQVFNNFYGYSSRINVVNTSETTGATYQFNYYNEAGQLVSSKSKYIDPLQLITAPTDHLQNGAYSLIISPK